MGTNYYWYPIDNDVAFLRATADADESEGWPEHARRLRDIATRLESTGTIEIHIGKTSVGWEFCFQTLDVPEIRSWKAWKAHLQQGVGVIKDEYDRVVPLEALIEIVESRMGKGLQNHADHFDCNDRTVFKDEEGYAFNEMEFS